MKQTHFEDIRHPHHKVKQASATTLRRDWNLRLQVLNTRQRQEVGVDGQNTKPTTLKVARWSRIPQEMIGAEVEVHNGKGYVRVKLTKERVGYRFGEFVTTTAWRTGAKKVESKPVSKGKGQAKGKK